MNQIAFSKFRATLHKVVRTVQETGEPILVTRRGEPLAIISPAGIEPAEKRDDRKVTAPPAK